MLLYLNAAKTVKTNGEQIRQNLTLYLNTAREAEIRGEQIKQNLSLYLNTTREAEIRGEQIKQKLRHAQSPRIERSSMGVTTKSMIKSQKICENY